MHKLGENPEPLGNPEVTYDKSDMSPRGVLGFLIALAVAGLIIHMVLWGMYKYLAKTQVHPTQINPMETSNRQLPGGRDPAQSFPAPRLQPDDNADLNKFRIHEEQWLNSYGWADEKAGLVHIPIERAMDLTVEHGLPTRPSPQRANTGLVGDPDRPQPATGSPPPGNGGAAMGGDGGTEASNRQ